MKCALRCEQLQYEINRQSYDYLLNEAEIVLLVSLTVSTDKYQPL